MKEIVVNKKYDGKKLNSFLLDNFDGLKLNTLYKALRKKDIRINNVNHTFAWEEPKFIQMILPDGTIESPIYSDLHENKIDDITDDIDDLVKKIISLGNYAQKEPGARK